MTLKLTEIISFIILYDGKCVTLSSHRLPHYFCDLGLARFVYAQIEFTVTSLTILIFVYLTRRDATQSPPRKHTARGGTMSRANDAIYHAP